MDKRKKELITLVTAIVVMLAACIIAIANMKMDEATAPAADSTKIVDESEKNACASVEWPAVVVSKEGEIIGATKVDVKSVLASTPEAQEKTVEVEQPADIPSPRTYQAPVLYQETVQPVYEEPAPAPTAEPVTEYVPEETWQQEVSLVEPQSEWTLEPEYTEYTGQVLTPQLGTIQGPSGKETYYNLPMSGVISIMQGLGNYDQYWVREDGVKMLGDYVMVAANLDVHPRGSLVETSRGTAIVCDTGYFCMQDPYAIDIATAW